MKKLKTLEHKLPRNVELLYSDRDSLINCLKTSDVIINCVLWPKSRQDHLIYEEDLKLMKKDALIVDVSCDENGAIETSRPTTHDNPTYKVNNILHYCVDNIPGAFSQTATKLLSKATIKYALAIANKGVEQALKENEELRTGLTCYNGMLTLEETGKRQNRAYVTPEEALKI
jgi:alanine dehydrogenase